VLADVHRPEGVGFSGKVPSYRVSIDQPPPLLDYSSPSMLIADSTWTTSASGTPWVRWFLLRDSQNHAVHLEGFTFFFFRKSSYDPKKSMRLG
jgi:hypothetical protein